MKCIHCGSDTTYPVRSANGGRCGACSHPFAFEPKTDPNTVSDGLFQKIIEDISAKGTLAFTERQLWFEFNRRLLGKVPFIPVPYRWGMGACMVGGIAAAVVTVFPPLFFGGVIATVITGVIGAKAGKNHPSIRYVRIPFDDFRSRYLDRYLAVHGPVEKLVKPVVARRGASVSPSAMPPDLTAYSFDRALITQDADTAAMLVANRFHFENNCAILSADRRYPQNGLFDTILEMLRRNPNLLLFTIHDASVEGLQVGGKLRAREWFPALGGRIFDLGLRPKHAIGGKMVLTRAGNTSIPPELVTTLAPDELKWLGEGNVGELAAIRPARLMRAIYQGFARANQMVQVADDGSIIFVDTGPDIWVYDTGGADIYASDSFG